MLKMLLICIWVIMFANMFVHSKLEESEFSENVQDLKNIISIFDAIQKSDMVKTAETISNWGPLLLKSFGLFANVTTSNFELDSKELQYIKEQFQIINEKIDYEDEMFTKVKQLIHWNEIKIQYATYELNSHVLKQQINELLGNSAEIKNVTTEKFLLTYDQLYRNTAENLYQGFVNSKKTFSENLNLAVRNFTKDYRSQIETFFTGNIQLILKCLQIESFFMHLSNLPNDESTWESQWSERLNNLARIMNIVLENVTENWEPTSKADIEEFNEVNSALSHKNYANKLYDFLKLKFPNRQWLVLVYDPLDSGTDHAIKVCNGVSQMKRRGHNIAVTSYPITGQSFEPMKYLSACSKIPNKVLSWGKGVAVYIFQTYLEPMMDCKYNQIGAAIRTKSDKFYVTPPLRSAQCEWSGYYNRIVNIHKTLHLLVLG